MCVYIEGMYIYIYMEYFVYEFLNYQCLFNDSLLNLIYVTLYIYICVVSPLLLVFFVYPHPPVNCVNCVINLRNTLLSMGRPFKYPFKYLFKATNCFFL